MVKQTPLTCSGHTRPVVDLSFSEKTDDGYFMISACKDGKPMLRHGDTGDWVGTFMGHKGAVWAATLDKTAMRAATGAADFSANLWNAITGDTIASFPHKHIVKSVSFNSDGTKLLTGCQDKQLRIFNIEKPEADPDNIGTHEGSIKKSLWHNNTTIISASDDKTIRKWDLLTKNEGQKIKLDSPVHDVEISNNGQLMTICHGNTIALYDANSFEILRQFDIDTPVYSASVDPKQKYIVAGGEDFKMYKFDFKTFEEIDSYKGHFGPVHIVRFSPDGELYASGSEDGTVRLWQTNIGTSYGLWRCVQAGEETVANSTRVEVPTNKAINIACTEN